MDRDAERELLQQLIEAAADPARFDTLLEQHEARLTIEFAQAAGALWAAALEHGHRGVAQRAALLAALVYARHGEQPEALRAQFEFTQFRFLAAETPHEYGAVREALHQLAHESAGIDARDTAFMAWTRAAESAYFAREGEADPQQQAEWLRHGVSDLVHAAGTVPDDPERTVPNFFATFVSVLCALYKESREHVAFDEEMSHTWWQTLAASVERHVRDDYALPAERAAMPPDEIRRLLSAISEQHGDPRAALRRLESGMADDLA